LIQLGRINNCGRRELTTKVDPGGMVGRPAVTHCDTWREDSQHGADRLTMLSSDHVRLKSHLE